LIAGTGVGVAATVRVLADNDNNGTYETVVDDIRPFGGFAGGVRVATGDFDGDGNDELVAAAGPGGRPVVKIFEFQPDGSVGPLRDSLVAYPGTFGGGVFVAAGDIDGDGRDELVTGVGPGGRPRVNIFSDADKDGRLSDDPRLDSFDAFNSHFRGGVRVAVGDIDTGNGPGTGVAELITAAGPRGRPVVKIWHDGDAPGSDGSGAVSDDPLFDSFEADRTVRVIVVCGVQNSVGIDVCSW